MQTKRWLIVVSVIALAGVSAVPSVAAEGQEDYSMIDCLVDDTNVPSGCDGDSTFNDELQQCEERALAVQPTPGSVDDIADECVHPVG